MDLIREVPGFNGKFVIVIKGETATCWNTNWRNTGKTKQVSNTANKNSYIQWNLNHIYKQAAQWVALTFPELVENEYFDGAEIDHKDTNRLNNNPTNLRWVSHKENMCNPLTVKKIVKNQTGKTNSNYRNKAQLNRKDMSKAVAQYTLNGDFVAWYPSAMEAERCLGQPHLNARISENCNNKRDTAGGYIWRYA